MAFLFKHLTSTNSYDDLYSYNPENLVDDAYLNKSSGQDTPRNLESQLGTPKKLPNHSVQASAADALPQAKSVKKIISQIVTAIPCSNASTYYIHELPYHMPPEAYKILLPSNLQTDSVSVLKRKQIWLSDTSNDSGSQGDPNMDAHDSGTGSGEDSHHNHSVFQQSTTNVSHDSDGGNSQDPFLQFFYKHKRYPKVQFESVHPEDPTTLIRSVFSKESHPSIQDAWDEGPNLRIFPDPNDPSQHVLILNRNVRWLWALSCNCEFIFCPEIQENASPSRKDVKHGDMVASQYHIGSVNHLIEERGPSRMGGEFYFNFKKKRWCVNNDSSYCFFRQDKMVLSNGRGFKWQNYIDGLFRCFGIETSDLMWIDKVQCRQLDGYIIQNTAFRYQRLKNRALKRIALDEFSDQQHKSFAVDETTKSLDMPSKFSEQEFQIIKHFKDMNLTSIFLGAFGADTLFLTEGKLELQIIQGVGIPSLELSSIMSLGLTNIPTWRTTLLEYPNRYCEVKLIGCERLNQGMWWSKSPVTSQYNHLRRTKSVTCRPNDTIYWNSENYQMHVTSHQSELLVIDVYQYPHVKLGHCIIDIQDLKPNHHTTEWFPVTLEEPFISQYDTKNIPQIGMSLRYSPHYSSMPVNGSDKLTTSIIVSGNDIPLQPLAYADATILRMIFSFLTKEDHNNVHNVCQYWKSVLSNEVD